MTKKASTGLEQLNFRLPEPLAKRIRSFCERHPFQPSLTRFAEIAFTEYLDKHEAELPPPPDARRK